jgi:hypothetical protein
MAKEPTDSHSKDPRAPATAPGKVSCGLLSTATRKTPNLRPLGRVALSHALLAPRSTLGPSVPSRSRHYILRGASCEYCSLAQTL